MGRKVEDAAEAERAGLPAPFWTVDWDFVLARKDDVRRNQLARAGG